MSVTTIDTIVPKNNGTFLTETKLNIAIMESYAGMQKKFRKSL